MICKQCWCRLLTISLVLCCLCIPAAAVSDDGIIAMDDLSWEIVTEPIKVWENQIESRVTSSIRMDVPAGETNKSSSKVSLDVGDTVTFDCVYSPASANVNYGVIAPDGRFYSLNTNSGRLNRAIRVSQRGSYSLAVRNNSTSTISVSGFVRY